MGDGEKAIEYTEKTQPDLIIMDIKMPKLDGLKASKIISKRYDIPILILTAYSQSEFVQEAKQSNIVGYIDIANNIGLFSLLYKLTLAISCQY